MLEFARSFTKVCDSCELCTEISPMKDIWKTRIRFMRKCSSVQAIREDLKLSQEDSSPTAADQVGKISDNYNWNITREIPDRFKSAVGYQANHSYLDSFQTSSGSSPQISGLGEDHPGERAANK